MELLWLSLTGAFLALDTNLVFMVFISQPLLSCSMIGLLSGDPLTGMHFGFLVQMLWLGNMPFGASSIPAGTSASLIGVIIYLTLLPIFREMQHLLLMSTFFYVILMSSLGARMVVWIRIKSERLLDWSINKAQEADLGSVAKISHISLLLNFIIFSLFLFTASIIGTFLMRQFLEFAPDKLNEIARYSEMAILGIGIGNVLPLYKERKAKIQIVLGFVAGIILFYIL